MNLELCLEEDLTHYLAANRSVYFVEGLAGQLDGLGHSWTELEVRDPANRRTEKRFLRGSEYLKLVPLHRSIACIVSSPIVGRSYIRRTKTGSWYTTQQ